jgi:hypothetical protein
MYGSVEKMHESGVSALTLLENAEEQERAELLGGEDE